MMNLPCGCEIAKVPTGYDMVQPCQVAEILIAWHEERGEVWDENKPLKDHIETGLHHTELNTFMENYAKWYGTMQEKFDLKEANHDTTS